MHPEAAFLGAAGARGVYWALLRLCPEEEDGLVRETPAHTGNSVTSLLSSENQRGLSPGPLFKVYPCYLTMNPLRMTDSWAL